ncbi:hypothetical protein GGS21DRAFT_329865 [Xylaria nigripes]|nr:hypothetical protein GGS21DRAFT_329865 [Xylaria nigripes]
MSVSEKPDSFHLRRYGTVQEDGQDCDLSSRHSNFSRQKGEEGLGTMGADTNQLHHLMTRPPPARPHIPPLLSTTVFSLQDRRSSMAASVQGDFDPSLTQPMKTDLYLPESTSSIGPNMKNSSPEALQKTAYTRVLPLNALSHLSAPTNPKTEQQSSTAFAPSSFPSSSPILPLAPHAALESTEIDVTGEIVSVLDDSGAGWKRHTRVYGGGVCLACLASGSHGGDGGFYGENVPLDQRR